MRRLCGKMYDLRGRGSLGLDGFGVVRGMGVDPHCALCVGIERQDHLFFQCGYSAQIWRLVLQRSHAYRRSVPWYEEKQWCI
ncbi:hypothetical protein LIER_32950 [Lithospermum erythrorhizon]|uniref:Reverse transcriptase zinc-binding domain-containing protein n=1 Tax=Lithospermum erythrorhizon TaxID=34254 RepID=A0AAV3RWN0_LITER